MRRRLIEQSIPLDAISAQSAREKSIRHGHISTLHIWWARRPLAAFCPAGQSWQEQPHLQRPLLPPFPPAQISILPPLTLLHFLMMHDLVDILSDSGIM